MSLGPNGLARFPLPASQGSGHGGWILTFPQALGWDGGGGMKTKKGLRIFMLGFPGPGKDISRMFLVLFYPFL